MPAFKLQTHGHFKALALNPPRLKEAIEAYFNAVYAQRESADIDDEKATISQIQYRAAVLTVPGLCTNLGTTKSKLKKLLEDPRIPEESVYYLQQALTAIETDTLEAGLSGRANSAMVKFSLSAYNEASEKSTREETITHKHTIIAWADPSSVTIGDDKASARFIEEQKHIPHLEQKRVNIPVTVEGMAAERRRGDQDGRDDREDDYNTIDVQFEEIDDDYGDII